jgi:exodeoxyribonuclease VII small subunit
MTLVQVCTFSFLHGFASPLPHPSGILVNDKVEPCRSAATGLMLDDHSHFCHQDYLPKPQIKATRAQIGTKESLMSQEPGDLSYEEAYQQLEKILQALENGDLPLEESLKFYELGAALANYCAHKLDEAELRIRQWQPGDQTSDLDDWQEA